MYELQHLSVNKLRTVGQGSVTGIASEELRVEGPRISFSCPQHPDRVWGPPGFLFNRYKGFFARGQSGLGVKLTRASIHCQGKKSVDYTSTPPHTLMLCTRDNFTYASTSCVRVFLYYLRHKASAYANLDFLVRCVFLCLSKLRDFRLPPRYK